VLHILKPSLEAAGSDRWALLPSSHGADDLAHHRSPNGYGYGLIQPLKAIPLYRAPLPSSVLGDIFLYQEDKHRHLCFATAGGWQRTRSWNAEDAREFGGGVEQGKGWLWSQES